MVSWGVHQLPSMCKQSNSVSTALSYPPREPRDLVNYIQSDAGRSYREDWTVYYLLLDISEKTGKSDRPEKYAKSEGFSQSMVNTVRGYWLLDHDRIAVSGEGRRSSLTFSPH